MKVAPTPRAASLMADRVEIRRDTFGVPHILAEDEEAAGFGFGYAMAEDHAAEIGRRYLQARGEAARYFGPSELESDLAMRWLDNRAGARRALAQYVGKGFRRWLLGFAAGVNHYAETHRDTVPDWMPVVEPSDPLAYGRMFGILAALDPPSRLLSKYPAPVLTTSPAASEHSRRSEALGRESGSNALALSGTKTTSGRPILLGAGSRGAVLFERFVSIYSEQYPDGFAIPWNALEPMTTPVGLADPAAAVAALERAVVEVRQRYGSERAAWGEVNRFRFGDIDLPGDGSIARHGVYRVVGFDAGQNGIRVAGNLSPGQPLAGFGDGWVLMVHFTRPVAAWSVLAYGQTANLESSHSRDQIRLFANHELRPVWFSEGAIAANVERRYRPGASAP